MAISREQLQEILDQAYVNVRHRAKQSEASIYYIKNDVHIREDAKGHKFEILFDSEGNRQERKYVE
ncbi:hypothetical protein [Saccharibacillus qingshengii]|uniref:hypothetical protein n=1 Tax=Saccharibacillus qingshengii TaxID=1763540 RepID=UPI001552F86B|nr:hypothetical protein [Saccharibacillus qingshengii]